MILEILISFLIPTIIACILLHLAYNKIKNVEKLNCALWQDRAKMAKRIKELEKGEET